MRNLYAGIDQSYTSTGLVILNDKQELVFSTVIRSNPQHSMHSRSSYVAEQLGQHLNEYAPYCAGIEGLAFGSRGNATRDLAGLQFVIVHQLDHVLGNCLYIIEPTKLKKYATGKARKIKKQQMVDALPQNIRDSLQQSYKKTKGLYDVTDAYWIARFVLEESNRHPRVIYDSPLEPTHLTKQQIQDAVKATIQPIKP